MKALLVIDMPSSCIECPFYENEYGYYCAGIAEKCPLKPVHSLKSGGRDYIIYERQFLYDNLDREIEMIREGKKIYESNISN